MKHINKSLSLKALIGIVFVLIPVLVSFLLSYYKNKEYLQNRILDTLTVVAEAYEGQVYQFLEKVKVRAQDFASDGFVRTQLHNINIGNTSSINQLSEHLLKNKLSLDKTINTINVLSLTGQIVASTNKAEIGKDLSGDASYAEGMNAIAIVEKRTGHNGLPEIAVSAPIYTKETKKPLGVIINYILISELDKLLIGEYVRDLGAVSWGKGKGAWKTLEMYLVNRDKLMITKSIFIEDAILKQSVDTMPVAKAFTSNEETSGFYKDYRGIDVAGVSMYFPSLNWVLLVEIDKDEVLAPVKYVLVNAVILSAVVIIMLVLLFIVFVRKVVRPLRVISRAATAIAGGSFDFVIPVTTQDEVGMLSESFNRMSRNLKERTQELMHSEEKLRSSEFKFRTLVDFTWDWEFWIDKNRCFYYNSPSCERLTGYTSAEVATSVTSFLGMVYPDDREKTQKELDSAFLQFSQTGFDFRIIHKNSSVRWVSMTYQPITDVTGEFLGVRASVRDITERKNAEEKIIMQSRITAMSADIGVALIQRGTLMETLQRCAEAMVRHLDVAFARIWTLNKDENMLELECSAGIYTHIDGAHSRVPVGSLKIGLIAEERKPHLTNSVIGDPRVSDQAWAKSMGMVAFAGYPLIIEDKLVGVMAMFSQKPIHESSFKALATVSDSIALCIERTKIANALKVSHNHNEQLIAAIPSILIYINEDDKIIGWNKTAERVFGITSGEATGMLFNNCKIQWYDKEIAHQILNCRNEHQPTRIDDVRFKNSIGKTGFLGLTVNPIRENGQKKPNLLITGSDITQRKIMESQLIQAQKLESIGQLAAGIAHEINTPTQYVGDNTRFLNDAFSDLCKVIESYRKMHTVCKAGAVTDELITEVETKEKEVDVEYLTEEIPKAIQQSLEGVDRVAKIVRAMKEFSHPGTDEKTPVDINKAIESTITVARNEWKYVAEIVTIFDASLPTVPCLPDAFNQVILNIIINAAHAVGDVVGNGKTGKGIITVSTARNGDCAEIRIQDTGTGIPESVRSKIFDPFFTTKGVGKKTGQGLAIAHDIVVNKHSGTITFETETGRGTVFILRLPLNKNHCEKLN